MSNFNKDDKSSTQRRPSSQAGSSINLNDISLDITLPSVMMLSSQQGKPSSPKTTADLISIIDEALEIIGDIDVESMIDESNTRINPYGPPRQ